MWRDPDKRRAALLSVVLHLSALLILLYVVTRPQPEPLPTFIVIDVGTPSFAEYMHIGDITARLAISISRSRNG